MMLLQIKDVKQMQQVFKFLIYQIEVEAAPETSKGDPENSTAASDDVLSLLQQHERKSKRKKSSDSDSDDSGDEIVRKITQQPAPSLPSAPLLGLGKEINKITQSLVCKFIQLFKLETPCKWKDVHCRNSLSVKCVIGDARGDLPKGLIQI